MHPIDRKSLFSLTGKTALVTGGSSGIGLMIAQGYIESGVKVYISSRNKEVCKHVCEALSAYGECYSIPTDLSSGEGRKVLIDELSQREESLSILVNNAGANWGGAFETYPDWAFDKILSLNLKAPFALSRDLLPLLKKAARPGDPARIINVGSMDGIHVPTVQKTGTFAYSASKAALHHLTQTLAVELGPRNITVNAVAPGYFQSKLASYALETQMEGVIRQCPLNRIGQAAEMAGIAIYLASRAGAYTNGAVIPVDGGAHLSKKGS